jgi:hypothetical protein
MLAKKHDPFIDLKDKRDAPTVAESSKEEPPRGPTLYVSDIDLPITDQDLNSNMVAEVRITPRQITRSTTNGKPASSFQLEITGIRFKG